ncbi:MAG: hypothetical protein NG747_09370 [Candidatus Brocadia sp.]|nr:hypothetical protein [Candidatus Brocadia sp.]
MGELNDNQHAGWVRVIETVSGKEKNPDNRKRPGHIHFSSVYKRGDKSKNRLP